MAIPVQMASGSIEAKSKRLAPVVTATNTTKKIQELTAQEQEASSLFQDLLTRSNDDNRTVANNQSLQLQHAPYNIDQSIQVSDMRAQTQHESLKERFYGATEQLSQEWKKTMHTIVTKHDDNSALVLKMQLAIADYTINGELFGKLVARGIQNLESLLRMQ